MAQDETWLTEGGDAMVALPGDLMVTDGMRTWSIRPASFKETYRHVADDVYERVGGVWARPAEIGESVITQEGLAVAVADDWLVTDDEGHSWFVPGEVFQANYRLTDPA